MLVIYRLCMRATLAQREQFIFIFGFLIFFGEVASDIGLGLVFPGYAHFLYFIYTWHVPK